MKTPSTALTMVLVREAFLAAPPPTELELEAMDFLSASAVGKIVRQSEALMLTGYPFAVERDFLGRPVRLVDP